MKRSNVSNLELHEVTLFSEFLMFSIVWWERGGILSAFPYNRKQKRMNKTNTEVIVSLISGVQQMGFVIYLSASSAQPVCWSQL